MQRKMEVIRGILESLEKATNIVPNIHNHLGFNEETIQKDVTKKFRLSENEYLYHRKLLDDAGYISKINHNIRLTWSGHEYLDSLRGTKLN
jgi:hypothetical protein